MKKTVYYGGMIPNILGGEEWGKKKKKKGGAQMIYIHHVYKIHLYAVPQLWENIKICIALYKYQKLKHVRSVQFDLSHFV